MFSESFMKFLMGNQDKENRKDENITEIEFNPVKVREAAKVVIESIKETF